jgi:cyclopropane-fatty-acyl-phospholipid synthase
MHAAANYGVEALGLTLSPHQAEVARERIRAAGLASKCRIEVENFLEFRPAETFDRIASVGAAEHVPEKCFNLKTAIKRSPKPVSEGPERAEL